MNGNSQKQGENKKIVARLYTNIIVKIHWTDHGAMEWKLKPIKVMDTEMEKLL